MTVITNRNIAQLRLLAAAGMTMREAGRVTGISKSTVRYWSVRERIGFPNRAVDQDAVDRAVDQLAVTMRQLRLP